MPFVTEMHSEPRFLNFLNLAKSNTNTWKIHGTVSICAYNRFVYFRHGKLYNLFIYNCYKFTIEKIS